MFMSIYDVIDVNNTYNYKETKQQLLFANKTIFG